MKTGIGTCFKHPRNGSIMKTGIGTHRSGRNQYELAEKFAKELHRRWSPRNLNSLIARS